MVKNRCLWAFWLLGMGLLYLFKNDTEARIILIASFLIPALLIIFVGIAVRKVAASLEVPEVGGKGTSVGGKIVIYNGSVLPALRVSCTMKCQNMLTGERKEEKLSIILMTKGEKCLPFDAGSDYCGKLHISIADCRLQDMFGLSAWKLKPPAEKTLIVVAETFEPQITIVENVNAIIDSDTYSMPKPGSNPSETFAIREYVPGDSIKSIHWKLSQKSESLMVREYGYTLKVDGYPLTTEELVYTLKYQQKDGSAYGGLLADNVVDYLCVGSQYTNGAQSYGNINGEYPERTLVGINNGKDQISLGSFGGYATYYFADPITNDPKNPYGVDFTVYGNGTSGSDAKRAKPGAVYVSEDGNTWYELAGSEHYDSNAIWDYNVTYTNNKEDGSVGYADNHGRSGSLGSGYGYPLAEKYALHHWTDAEKESMTFNGTLLLGSNGWDYATSGVAAATQWGYAGTKISPTAVSTEDLPLMTGNPYVAKYQSSGSGFDLAWAVDKDGKPVSLTSAKYVKVMSSSLLQSDSTDESSAVVYSVAKSAPFSYDNGTTTAPSSIKIGDREVKLESGVYSYDAEVSSQNYTVQVDTSKDANVYINNVRGNSREYSHTDQFDFEKGILRIVVQENESAPLIYYVALTNTAQKGDGFTDVDAGAWYANAVNYVVDAELFMGVSNDKFAPDSELTRAMLVTVLYRAEKSPAVTGSNPFTDVGEGLYYSDAVIWATENEIVNGIGDGLFAPEQNITRQELAAILYRYAIYKECDIEEPKPLTQYSDAGEVADWAQDAMKWAVSSGVIQGTSDTTLSPNKTATRAEVAMMMMRLFENVL